MCMLRCGIKKSIVWNVMWKIFFTYFVYILNFQQSECFTHKTFRMDVKNRFYRCWLFFISNFAKVVEPHFFNLKTNLSPPHKKAFQQWKTLLWKSKMCPPHLNDRIWIVMTKRRGEKDKMSIHASVITVSMITMLNSFIFTSGFNFQFSRLFFCTVQRQK